MILSKQEMTAWILLLSFLGLVNPLTAEAYIDLGTGSFIVQAILAGILGAAFYLRVLWRRLKKPFGSDQAGTPLDEKDEDKKTDEQV